VKTIGILGCGTITERGHLPALMRTQGVGVATIYDRTIFKARDLQNKFGLKHVCESEEEFWRSDCDAVVICTPAPLHKEHVLKAARHGKHVLCEKPLAMNEADIAEMIQTMNDAGLMLFTGFTYRFSHSAHTIYHLVREGAIGTVRSLRLVYLWNLHGKWRTDANGARIPHGLRVERMLEGGPMVDCGVHQIDLARWWLGSEVQWHRGIGAWVEDYEAPDHMYLHMGHENGAQTMVEMSFSYTATAAEPRSHFQYELIGTDGIIRYNREEHVFEVRNSRGTEWLQWHPEKNFAGMYAEFTQALHTGQPQQMPTGQDGLIATKIAWSATLQAMRERVPAVS